MMLCVLVADYKHPLWNDDIKLVIPDCVVEVTRLHRYSSCLSVTMTGTIDRGLKQ